MYKAKAMDNPDLIPVMVLRVDTACCKECPRNLRKGLLKLDGVREVAFDSEYKNVCIRSTIDPLMIIKVIAKMDKIAELIFYDKEPTLDHRSRHKNPETSEGNQSVGEDNEQNTRVPKGKGHKDDREGVCKCKENVKGNGKKTSFCCTDDHHQKPRKNDDRDANDQYCTRNVRENGQEKYNRHDHDSDSPRENGHSCYYRCPNYDSPNNVGEDGREKHYGSPNYGPHREPSEDNRTPKMFFDDADIFMEYSWRRNTFGDGYMPSRDRDSKRGYKDNHDQFRSKSCRYDARNSQRWYGPEATPYENIYNSAMPSFHENRHSGMPPPFEQYSFSMPPPPPPPTSIYHSDFSGESRYGCIVM